MLKEEELIKIQGGTFGRKRDGSVVLLHDAYPVYGNWKTGYQHWRINGVSITIPTE